MTQQPGAATNVFDAAKTIAETLKHLDKQQQEQAIRYASDSLGLGVGAHSHQAVGASAAAGMVARSPSASHEAHSTDIRSFTEAKSPKSDNQFAAVVAYFYRFEAPDTQKRDAIDAKSLQEAARLAGRKRLQRPAVTLVHAKNRGYLDLVGGGKYAINAVGENLVAMTLPGGSNEFPSARSRQSAARRRATKVSGKKARAKGGA